MSNAHSVHKCQRSTLIWLESPLLFTVRLYYSQKIFNIQRQKLLEPYFNIVWKKGGLFFICLFSLLFKYKLKPL